MDLTPIQKQSTSLAYDLFTCFQSAFNLVKKLSLFAEQMKIALPEISTEWLILEITREYCQIVTLLYFSSRELDIE